MKTKLYFLLFALIAYSASIFASVKIGDLYYNLDKSRKTAEVTYQKYFEDTNYMGLTIVHIPSVVTYENQEYSVTSIRDAAFAYCSSLTSITISKSITNIGHGAFHGCSSLTSIIIPNSVTSIGNLAFSGCSSLTSVTIPNSVISIGGHAFSNCSSLTSVTIPNSVTSIGENAFGVCSSLTSVDIPNSVTSIGNYAFAECSSLTAITITNSVTSIGVASFRNCSSLTAVTIPNSVTSIGESAFFNCSNLVSITLPNSVTSIESWVFGVCSSLTSIDIPNSVTSIGKHAFFSCSSLTSITIPNSVTSIGDSAFSYCSRLYINTASNASIPNFPSNRVKKISQEEYIYSQPFSSFAKSYVEQGINTWQQKGEFEKTADWQKRVNEQTRQQKINDLLAEAEQKYIAHHNRNVKPQPVLGKYDADNEVFAMTDNRYGTTYMAVPIEEARYFKENWASKNISFQLQIKDDNFKLASMVFRMPNGKEYTYRNTDAVNYNLADIEYNFAPIELNLSSSSSAQGQQHITTTKIKAGKSAVDTDIPVTNAANPNTFVIIFANEDYKNVASVPFAKNDGAIFQKYCQQTLGIPVSNIQYVENASFNDMRIKLAWLNDVCNAFDGNASLIVYYAGHGIPDEASKSAYLLPVDGDSRYVQSAYKLDDFYQKLGAMNAKSVTVFMDACFSGSKREQGMLAEARGVALKAHPGQPKGNMVVFSAAQGDETAWPYNAKQHGLFTYYLLKKLQDTKGDVMLKDLGTYITSNVKQQSVLENNKIQTPSVTPASTVANTWQSWKLK